MDKIYLAIVALSIAPWGYLGLRLVLKRYRNGLITFEPLRLDPYELSAYPSNPDINCNFKKPLVVFFGDSRAYEWLAIANASFEFINRGIGGQTTSQVLGRISAHVANLAPQFVVVQVGVNDLKHIVGLPHQAENIIINCKQNIQKTIDQLTKDLQVTVILTTIFPISALSKSQQIYWSQEIDRAIIEVNQFIKSLKGDRIIILDAANILADEHGKTRQIYSRDFLHLNDNGYKVLNDELSKILTCQVHKLL